MPSTLLQIGEPAPWFEARSPVNPRFHFDTVAGRYVVLYFFASAAEPTSRRVLDDILPRGGRSRGQASLREEDRREPSGEIP